MAGEIDKKYLDGLIVTGSTEKQAKNENGRMTRKFTPYERPAKPSDVIAWTESDTAIGIVLRDGKKYRVLKTAAKGKGPTGQKPVEGTGDGVTA
jgi:hypothetical protein